MERSILGDVKLRVPVGGRIRAGLKVLKRAAADKPLVRQIYEDGLAKGQSFDEIEARLEKEAKEKGALIPCNVPWFTVRRTDFHVPAMADEILALYGEARPDHPAEKRLYAFPVVLATDNWLDVLPHTFMCRDGRTLKYWADYDKDGMRRCQTHATVQFDPKSRRKQFPKRQVILRADNAGLCEPERCEEFALGLCKLSGFLRFYVHGLKGMFLFEIPTTSFYALAGARAQLEEVLKVRGRISGLLDGRPLLWITKRRQEISRYSLEHQRYVREKQWLIAFEVREHGVEAVMPSVEQSSSRPLLASPPRTTDHTAGGSPDKLTGIPAKAEGPASTVGALRKELFDLVQERGVDMKLFSQRNLILHGEGWGRNERALGVLLQEARDCPAEDYADLLKEAPG
jgi:recombination directionality factor gp3-like protein